MLRIKSIKKFLNSKDYNLILLNKTDSTNNYAKKLPKPANNTVIIAKRQTSGRGRLGRSFISMEGGLYLTCIVKPYSSSFNAGLITACAAVAVSKAINEVCGIECGIKWVNDLYIKNKKVCGILSETIQFEGLESNIIIGVGINVNRFKPKGELKEIATSLGEYTKKAVDINLLAARIINNIYTELNKAINLEFLKEYREKSIVIGKEVEVIVGDEKYTATALRINDDCCLTVLKDNEEINLNFGEISIKTR